LVSVAIIGIGGIAESHLRPLSQSRDVELIAAADIAKEKAEKASAYGIKRFYVDYREMVEKEKPEAVYILTPAYLHQEQVCFAAEYGAHIFVEKPLECDFHRAKRILETLKRHRVITQVGYHWRFMDANKKAREILHSQGGPIGLVEGRWWGGIPGAPWWTDVKLSGGQVTEQTTHIFDQARWLAGEVRRVYAVLETLMNRDVPNFRIEDVAVTVLRFEGGAVGIVSSTNACSPGEIWVKAIAKNVKYETDGSKATVYWKDRAETYYNRVNAYAEEDRVFIDCVRRGVETPVPIILEGYKSLELSLASRESSLIGKPVTIPL